jgi:hypothetical protein
MKRYKFLDNMIFPAMKRYNWSNFLAMKRYNRFRNLFFEAMQRYNIRSYKSFTDEATQSPSILENVSITTAILKIGSFIPQNVIALAEEALHDGTGRHRCIEPHKKFRQNWPTHESLHKIHLGRACQPVSHYFYGICFVN